jgi:peptidoglycan/LPS O-acetylase OafA/YrhL
MIGEFFFDDTFRSVVVVLFGTGLLSVLYYYLIELPRQKKLDALKQRS